MVKTIRYIYKKTLAGFIDAGTLLSDKPTGNSFDDCLIEEWEAVVEIEGEFFSFIYRKSCAHYRWSCGDDEDPFGYLTGDTVPCQLMKSKEVLITVYEPV